MISSESAMPVSRLKTFVVLAGFPAVSWLISLILLYQEEVEAAGLNFYYTFWAIIICWYALQMFWLNRVLTSEGLTFRDIGFRLSSKGTFWLITAYFVLAGIVWLLVEWQLSGAVPDPGKLSDFSDLTPLTTTQRGIFILAGCLAGLAEELVYRGFAIRALRGFGLPGWIAVIVAAVPFVLQHGLKSMDQFAWFFITGLFFGFLFLWLKRLWIPVLIHWLIILSAVLAVLQAIP